MTTDQLHKKILECLTFAEPFSTLEEEVDEEINQIADALKYLIAKEYVQPMAYNSDADKWEKSMFYDADNMKEFWYRITSKGLKVLF